MAQDAPKDTHFLESQLTTRDGLTLSLKHWRPTAGEPRGHVLLIHGYMEHAGRFRELAHALGAADLATTALDMRGHGKSGGQRGRVDRFDAYLDDVQMALDTLPKGPRFILGHSNGALVALDFVVSRRPALQGLVVTNPFLAQTVPAKGLKLWLGVKAGKHLPALSLPSGLDAAGISHDAHIVEAYKRDPLVFGAANAAWFREVQAAQTRVRGYTTLDVPFLYVLSDADPIASPAANLALSAQLQGKDKTVVVRRGEFHEVLNETQRAGLHQDIAAWCLARC